MKYIKSIAAGIFFAAFLDLCMLSGAPAQNVMCPTRSPGDSTNACASTAFVSAVNTALQAQITALQTQVTNLSNAFSTFQTTAYALFLPHVGNLTALQAYTGAGPVMRDGYSTAGDSPAIIYNLSSGACTRNDGGLQVTAQSGNCWIANLDRTKPVDGRIWGAKCDDTTDDSVPFSNALYALGSLGGGKVFVPPTGKGCRINVGIEQPLNGTGLVGNGDFEWGGPAGAKSLWLNTGSWLDCATSTKACVKWDSDGFVEDLNFWEDQPTPVVGWSPTQYPFAIEFDQNYSHARNIHLANVYDGIDFHGPVNATIYGSKNYFDNIWAGAFHIGVRITNANDTVECHHFHDSMQWQINSPGIQAWLDQYAIGWDLHYVDNMFCEDAEFYKTANAIRFTNSTTQYGAGTVTHAAGHLAVNNISFNLVPQAIAINSNNTILSAQFTNVIAQTDTDNGVAATCFFDLQTAYADLLITQIKATVGKALACVGSQITNTIIAASWASGQVTLTTQNTTTLVPGSTFFVSGMSPSAYNGTYTALSGTGGNTVVYALGSNPGTATTFGYTSENGSKLKISQLDMTGTPSPGYLGSTVGNGAFGYNYQGGNYPAVYIAKGSTVTVPTGWQDVISSSATAGPKAFCAGPILGGGTGSNCGVIGTVTQATTPTNP